MDATNVEHGEGGGAVLTGHRRVSIPPPAVLLDYRRQGYPLWLSRKVAYWHFDYSASALLAVNRLI
jgi:hypothetical protein